MNEDRMSFCDFDLSAQVEADRKEHEAEQQAREHVRASAPGVLVRPRDLQATHRLGFSAACRVLEALEKDGELVRDLRGGTLAWSRAHPPGKPPRGYALPLSSKEHGALLRLLDWKLSGDGQGQGPDDADLLRAIRARAKRPA
jgi:hypothetical protein